MNYLQKKKQAIIMMLAAQIVKSAQGYPVTISDSRSGRAADYTIWGNTAAAGKNLIPYPYYNKTKTMNGVTFTDNGDGSVTANGTATANAQFDLAISLSLDTTKKYTLSRAIDSSAITVMLALYKGGTWKKNIQLTGSNTSITIDFSSYSDIEFDGIRLRLVVAAGTTVDNVTIKPQLELGTTATEYEPYKAGFVGDKTDNSTDEYKIQIVNSGKNLIPYPYYNKTKTMNGVTFTDNGDGSVTANGTATANAYFYMMVRRTDIDTTKRYVLSGSTPDVCVYVSLSLNDVWKKDIYSRGKPVIVDFPSYTNIEYNQVGISLYVLNGTTVDTVTIRPQLELGETATEYVPYRAPSTAVIYRSAPLKKGESINFRSDGLPKLTLFEGENNITASTSIKPEKISVDYYEK